MKELQNIVKNMVNLGLCSQKDADRIIIDEYTRIACKQIGSNTSKKSLASVIEAAYYHN